MLPAYSYSLPSTQRRRKKFTPFAILGIFAYLAYRDFLRERLIAITRPCPTTDLKPPLPPQASAAPPPVRPRRKIVLHKGVIDYEVPVELDLEHHPPEIITDLDYFKELGGSSIAEPTSTPKSEPTSTREPEPVSTYWIPPIYDTPIQNHTNREDGYLILNPDGQHPIHDLIHQAQRNWKAKLDGQSRTLMEAVGEYRRRYSRDPPPGFEHWWDYVVKHKVQLPDEYDSLHASIEPLWGVDPQYLQERRQEWENQGEIEGFTLGKLKPDDPVTLQKLIPAKNGDERNAYRRASMQLLNIREIGKYIPPFQASFSAGDGPWQFVGWAMKQKALEFASIQLHTDFVDLPAQPHQGWASACPPTSPIHKDKWNVHPNISALHNAPKTFVQNHIKTMDPCTHPNLVHIVGMLSNHQTGPGPAAHYIPSFAISTTPLHSDLLAVAPEGFTEQVGYDPEWQEKTSDKLFWRGSTTGAYFANHVPWGLSQRIRLVLQATEKGTPYTILNSTLAGFKVSNGTRTASEVLNSQLLDVAFTGQPIQCETEEICQMLEDSFEFQKLVSQNEANQYKFLLDIDGNAWSARFKRLMTTKSCVLKSTMFPEWYSDRIQEWVHYVPVKVDFTDLYDIMTFFQEERNDPLAEAIGAAGRDWSLTFYRKEDMTAYMFRLFLEYSRVMREDRDQLRAEF